jgi:hypothetical protein
VREMQWARLQATVGSPLRRGAWYRVVSVTRLEAVVDVKGARVAVPRPFVEIRALPPREWTIVREGVGRGPENIQSGYIVCPSCWHRVVLPFTQVPKLKCPRCERLFDIGWSEAYLPRT